MAETSSAAPSQTLSRGIRILEVLADTRAPLAIDDIAHRLGLHRSITYRLVRTLEHHGLVGRDATGRVALGARLAALSSAVSHDLQSEALPELTAVANELGMTCFLTILDHDECITLVSVEPRHATTSVAHRPGSRHPLTRGAPGRALLSQLPPDHLASLDPALGIEVARTRHVGWATSHDEVVPTLRSVAVPLAIRGRTPAAVAVVFMASDRDDDEIASRLTTSASAIRAALGG